MAQLEEAPAPAVEETSPQPPPAAVATPYKPTLGRVAELPKGATLFNVLSRAIHASRRIGFGLLTAVAVDPLKKIKSEQEAVNALEPKLNQEIEAKMAELQKAGQTGDLKLEATRQVVLAHTADFRKRIADGESLESIKTEAFAVARKSAEVVLKMRPYDVQVMGGLAMTEGRISEMKTGEGKTLTAVMPLYLYGLTGKGAHLVTVNDYLVKRDFEQMKPLFEFMGLSAGCVHEGLSLDEKKAAYNCDVTYITNHSVGFDFLRDSMAREPEARVQRPPNFALVDEVDEILIDEARTPLILSSLAQAAGDEHRTFDIIVKTLDPGRDFKSNHKDHYCYLTEDGLEMVETLLSSVEAGTRESEASIKLRSLPPGTPLEEVQAATRAYDNAHKATQAANKLVAAHLHVRQAQTDEEKAAAEKELAEAREGNVPRYDLYSRQNVNRVFFLQNALDANVLFTKGEDYLAENNKVEIVDQFKGRTMEGRRYSNGLHQALEAKEGVTIQPYQRTLAQITYPDLFRRYPHLAGMSGTAMSAAGEFNEAYNLDVVAIPTNKPKALKTDNDIVFRTLKEKMDFVADRVAELYREGKPVLVGTRSIPANQYLSRLLADRGIQHQVLNAQNVHENTGDEADILADAGRSGMVTIATNMAGRGVDIKPDLMNYKLMSMNADVANREGRAVILDVNTQKDADQIALWLDSGSIPYTVVPAGQPTPPPQPGKPMIRLSPSADEELGWKARHLDARSEGAGDLSAQVLKGLDQRGICVDVATAEQADQLLNELKQSGRSGLAVAPGETQPFPGPGQVVVRIAPEAPPTLVDPGTMTLIDGRSEAFQTGGLHLIMTERHEAERIDLQLEGRPARQGQPGYRLAVLSLEDELLKYFGGDKLDAFFDAMGVQPGQGVSDPRIDEMIRNAQHAVESKYYEVRKDTTKYGQVLNKQREAFTAFRTDLVDREANLDELSRGWIPRAVAADVFRVEADKQREVTPEEEWVGLPHSLKADQLKVSLAEVSQKYGFPIDLEMPSGLLGKKKRLTLEELEEALRPQLMARYDELSKEFPRAELENYQRKTILDVSDETWMNHLENIEGLRRGIGMEAMAQKDPWIEYQRRAYDLFVETMDVIEQEAGSAILLQMQKEAAMKKAVPEQPPAA